MITNKTLPIIKLDEWLIPSEESLQRRYNEYIERLSSIESSSGSLLNYANAHLFYGFNYDPIQKGWWFREWLPNAIEAFVYGDFNNWNRTQYKLTRVGENVEIFFADAEHGTKIEHEGLYKMYVHGDNGFYERIPAYAKRVVEDVLTHNFSAQIWNPEKEYKWEDKKFKTSSIKHPIIYEAHIGMATEQERVGLYRKFTRDMIPKIKKLGYNTIQLMAIAEHPYYGSFGYHVSNFFAPSSRYGTPEELKALIDTAHQSGLAVILDTVHSHYIKNFNEGLNELDGSPNHYSPAGERGNQPYWDSKTFDYGKVGVEHFLLSNIKYWMEQYHFDGFRFDGVTSMLYHHHGYTDLKGRDLFFGDEVNEAGIKYLTLANTLIHTINKSAISIAEDVSGMPTVTVSTEDGGMGFDYRLAMNAPDFWIDYIENLPDEDWNIWDMWEQMTNRLPHVKTIGYAESHDQAMVGDKTIAFRLMDRDMYCNMHQGSHSIVIDRGIAIHKMIRLFTLTTAGTGYLNFMGNEFGHPEWIDFPREGNGYSYEHARRQWSLVEDKNLRYKQLESFDTAMLKVITKNNVFDDTYPYIHLMDEENKTMVFTRGDLLFIFNWDFTSSIANYIIPVSCEGEYEIALDADSSKYGGFERIDPKSQYFSRIEMGDDGEERHYISVYNVSRNVLVLKLINKK